MIYLCYIISEIILSYQSEFITMSLSNKGVSCINSSKNVCYILKSKMCVKIVRWDFFKSYVCKDFMPNKNISNFQKYWTTGKFYRILIYFIHRLKSMNIIHTKEGWMVVAILSLYKSHLKEEFYKKKYVVKH